MKKTVNIDIKVDATEWTYQDLNLKELKLEIEHLLDDLLVMKDVKMQLWVTDEM